MWSQQGLPLIRAGPLGGNTGAIGIHGTCGQEEAPPAEASGARRTNKYPGQLMPGRTLRSTGRTCTRKRTRDPTALCAGHRGLHSLFNELASASRALQSHDCKIARNNDPAANKPTALIPLRKIGFRGHFSRPTVTPPCR